MSIEMKLDTNALSSLIEADPTFRANIQQSVLTNIANRYLKVANTDINKAIESAISIAKKEVTKEFGTYTNGYSSSFQLHTAIADDIKRKISERASLEAGSIIQLAIDAAVVERMAGIEAKIEAKVAAAMIRYTDQTVADAVKNKVNAALAQIKF